MFQTVAMAQLHAMRLRWVPADEEGDKDDGADSRAGSLPPQRTALTTFSADGIAYDRCGGGWRLVRKPIGAA